MLNSLLTLHDISYCVGRKTIINNISLTINEHDFIILLGANGSGKSSLFKLINGSNKPNSGIMDFCSKLAYKDIVSLSQKVEDHLCLSMTIYEHFRLYSATKSLQDKTAIKNYLLEFNVKLAHQLDEPIVNFSGGEKQLLALALCLLQEPKLLLLDEHTSALDPKTSRTVMDITQKIITRRKLACVMTTHQIDYALSYGNRLVALRDGAIHQLVESDKKSSLSTETLLSACYAG